MAKQRELSGTLESESEAKLKKQLSDAKCKELSGHDIFAPPPEIVPRPAVRSLAYKENFNLSELGEAPIDVQTPVKASNVSELRAIAYFFVPLSHTHTHSISHLCFA